jgi:hypothetical protein
MTHIIDNEASEEYKKKIGKKCTIQLVPPDSHSCNLVEQAIQTFKNHFKAILAGVDDTFSMRLWDRLLPQTILTLNFLRQSNAIPTVLAHQYIHGNFNYNKMPLAPMGCAVQLHQSSKHGASWAKTLIDGWYLQTSPEHYQCHMIYMSSKRKARECQTQYFSKQNTSHNLP